MTGLGLRTCLEIGIRLWMDFAAVFCNFPQNTHTLHCMHYLYCVHANPAGQLRLTVMFTWLAM